MNFKVLLKILIFRMPFKKAPKKGVVEIKGLKTSPNHLVKCASTGVPSIDTLLLGGGLPVGYILSVVADEPRIYSYILHKFFSPEECFSVHRRFPF